MEWIWSFLSLSIITFSLPSLLLYCRRKSGTNRLPPGPPGWPIFGHMFNLGSLPHRTLARIQQQYGPVVWLKLGSINTLVVQNAKSATELFKIHDLAFADRYDTEALRSHGYNKVAISVSLYNTTWRFLRRLGTVEMFVNKKITETSSIRQKCVNDMIEWIEKQWRNQNAELGGSESPSKKNYLLTLELLLSAIRLRGDNCIGLDKSRFWENGQETDPFYRFVSQDVSMWPLGLIYTNFTHNERVCKNCSN